MPKPIAFIIEDNKSLAEIFAFPLKAAGYEIEIFRDGNQALAGLADSDPDTVVLDLHLSGASGEEILRYLRSDQRFAHTRVILTTGDRSRVQRLRAELRAESDWVLIKPFGLDQLQAAAAYCLPQPV